MCAPWLRNTSPGTHPNALMISHPFPRFAQLAVLVLLGLFPHHPLYAADPKDVKLVAQLVWATEHPKPKQEMKELDRKLSDKLRKMFKWKNYFEIDRQSFDVPPTGTRKIKMSSKCELELQQLDSATLEVKLYGEGKLVKTIRQPVHPLQKGEYAAIGGDDKDSYGDAWFVVLSAPTP